jgi:hypothetical protein
VLLARPEDSGRHSCCRLSGHLGQHFLTSPPSFRRLPDHTPGSACPSGQRLHFRHAGHLDAGTRLGPSTSRWHLPPMQCTETRQHLDSPS